jgi:hypothetical protein
MALLLKLWRFRAERADGTAFLRHYGGGKATLKPRERIP